MPNALRRYWRTAVLSVAISASSTTDSFRFDIWFLAAAIAAFDYVGSYPF